MSRRNNQLRNDIMTLESHSAHTIIGNAANSFPFLWADQDCRVAFVAVKTAAHREKPHIMLQIFMLLLSGLTLLYHDGTKRPR